MVLNKQTKLEKLAFLQVVLKALVTVCLFRPLHLYLFVPLNSDSYERHVICSCLFTAQYRSHLRELNG